MEDMQTKLNERVRKYLDLCEFTSGALKASLAMILVMGGYFLFLKTNAAFGDVPMLLGAYYLKKLFSEI
jgi:hypothetical protein